MAQKVEDSLNFVWRIDYPRGIAQRISEYLTLILVGPVVMVTAMALIAKVKSNALIREVSDFEPVGETLLLMNQFTPYALVVLGFTLVYWFLPNTRVRFRAALAGGVGGRRALGNIGRPVHDIRHDVGAHDVDLCNVCHRYPRA